MANTKISDLPAATTVTGTDTVVVVQGGATKKATPGGLPVSTAQAAADTVVQNYAVQRGNHTGTQTADTITDGITNKAYTATERTKLAGVATGATANRADSVVDGLLAAKADLVGGLIPSSQIPSLSMVTAVPVANQAAMLALTSAQVQPGDLAIRADGAGTFILLAADPSQLANWSLLAAPTDVVTSVAGRNGAVTLGKSDVGLSNVDNTADASKPVSTAQAAADSAAVAAAQETSAQRASNLSDLASASAARSNLGLGTAAVQSASAFDAAGAATAAQAAAIAASLSATDPASQQLAADGVSVASPWQQFTTLPLRPATKVINRLVGAQGWTGGGGFSEDTTTILFGDRTLKWTVPVSSQVWPTSATFTAQSWANSTIRIWLKVDNPANLAQAVLYVDTGSGNRFANSIAVNFSPNEWIPVTIPLGAFSISSGTPNWAGVTSYDLSITANSGGTLNFWFGGIELIPDLASTYPSGVMICELDDGYAGQFTYGLPVFAQRGIPVTFNVIGERFVGSPSASGKYAADLRTLQDTHGWQISCHAYSSAAHGSTTNPAAMMEMDFQRQKQWLHANGLHAGADHYALCPGTGGPVAAGAMMQALEKSFRSVRVNSGYYETAVPADPLRLRSILFSGAGNNVTNLKANIDKAAVTGGAFIFTMHDVIAGATDGTSNGLAAIGATNLATVLDYAASKGMVFRTRADYIDGR